VDTGFGKRNTNVDLRGLRGFDSLVQTASGIAHAGGAARGGDRPVPLPAQALDHTTGYLAAYGAMAMVARQHQVGGSWHVRLSLAQSGRWLQSLGHADTLDLPDLHASDVEPWLGLMRSDLGELSYVTPPGALASYAPSWRTPPVPLGSSPPTWGP
jgi:hypothetical protein